MDSAPFTGLDVLLCFPVTTLQQRGAAFSGILYHIYNKNHFGGYSCILRTAGSHVHKGNIFCFQKQSVCMENSLLEAIPVPLNPCSSLGMVGRALCGTAPSCPGAPWQQSTTGSHGLRPESFPSLVLFTGVDLSVQPSIPTTLGRKETLLAKVSRTPSQQTKSYWQEYR